LIRLVVFDMDGVLVDSMPALTILASLTIHRYFGIPITKARDYYLSTVGLPFCEQLDKIFPSHHPSLKSLVVKQYEESHAAVLPLLPLAPHAGRVIWECRARGIGTGLVSSTNASYIDQMDQISGLEFDFVRGYRPDIGKQLQIEDIIQEAHIKPSEVIYFGDTTYDGQIAKTIGTNFRLTECETFANDFDKTCKEFVYVDCG
jgi:phosphoserine phosphatase